MSQITVTKKQEDDRLTLFLDGRADSSNSERLKDDIMNGLDEVKYIVIDCENLSFISSSGLRVLLILFKRIKERGGDLVVTKPTRKVTEILKITGFNEIFSIKAI